MLLPAIIPAYLCTILGTLNYFGIISLVGGARFPGLSPWGYLNDLSLLFVVCSPAVLCWFFYGKMGTGRLAILTLVESVFYLNALVAFGADVGTFYPSPLNWIEMTALPVSATVAVGYLLTMTSLRNT